MKFHWIKAWLIIFWSLSLSLFWYGTNMIICHAYQVEMIPYKPLYVWDKWLVGYCTSITELRFRIIKLNFQECQKKFLSKWKVEIDDYYIDDKVFCCFVQEVLECEAKILSSLNCFQVESHYVNITKKTFHTCFDQYECVRISKEFPTQISKKKEVDGVFWLDKALVVLKHIFELLFFAGLILSVLGLCCKLCKGGPLLEGAETFFPVQEVLVPLEVPAMKRQVDYAVKEQNLPLTLENKILHPVIEERFPTRFMEKSIPPLIMEEEINFLQ